MILLLLGRSLPGPDRRPPLGKPSYYYYYYYYYY